ncbi:ankyrin, partial [Aureobasidium pullulans EXF-150]
LHMAIESRHEGIVRILLEEGVDINERNSEGSTALYMTIQKRQENMLQLLLKKGANVDIVDNKGRKLVHLA